MLRSRKIRVSEMLLKISCYKFATLYLILAIVISDSVDLQEDFFNKFFEISKFLQ